MPRESRWFFEPTITNPIEVIIQQLQKKSLKYKFLFMLIMEKRSSTGWISTANWGQCYSNHTNNNTRKNDDENLNCIRTMNSYASNQINLDKNKMFTFVQLHCTIWFPNSWYLQPTMNSIQKLPFKIFKYFTETNTYSRMQRFVIFCSLKTEQTFIYVERNKERNQFSWIHSKFIIGE